MNPLKKGFCRVYQFCFHLALPVLPYREPKILKSVTEIPAEIKKLNLKKVLIITDEFLKKSGAIEDMELSLHGSNVDYIVYGKARRQGRKSPLSRSRIDECKGTREILLCSNGVKI